jgi:hypothetical protein
VHRLDPQDSEEALKILYRIRGEWEGREGAPPGGLGAIETLIEEYERELGRHDQSANQGRLKR